METNSAFTSFRQRLALASMLRRNDTEEHEFGFTPEQVHHIMSGIYFRGDQLMRRFVLVHFAIALLLASFYDTWGVALAIGGASVAMVFVATTLLPRSFLTRCIISVGLQVFVALHIYQMHGLAEMHFFFFTASTLMIVYQDWLSMWPGTLLIIAQHTLFAILHNTGLQLYFFEDPYVGFRKLFFHFSIVVGQAVLCGFWSHLKRRQTLQAACQQQQLRESQQLLALQLESTRRSESSLRFSEERLRLAQSAAEIGTWDWDISANSAVCSAQYYGLYGVPYRVGFPSFEEWLERLHPEDRDRAAQAVQRALGNGGAYADEYRVVWPDGSVHWLVARARVFVDNSHKPVRMIGVNLDVTDRRRSEQALCEANEQLQQFVHAASHDLQEPLRTITSYTQLLARRYGGRSEADADELVQFVLQGTERMRNLIKALLSFSTARSIEPEPAWLPLEDVLANVTKDLELATAETGAEITSGPLPTVFADGVQLQQLLQNLISNALKYRSTKSPRVHIRAIRSNLEWIIAVEDNGIGIDSHHHDRIFGLFKRLHGPSISGSGIGLATCKMIVERHGGRIWVDSKIGQGSTFSFSVPLDRVRQTVESAELGRAVAVMGGVRA